MKFIKLNLIILVISLIDSSMGKGGGIIKPAPAVRGKLKIKTPRAIQTLPKIEPHVMAGYMDGARYTFDTIQKGVKWFNRLRQVVEEKKNIGGKNGDRLIHSNLLDEIQDCRPDLKSDRCYSRCERNDTKYQWCYTSSEHRDTQWDYCSCRIRKEIVEFLQIKKGEFLLPPVKPWTTTELSLMVTVGVLAFIVIVMVSGIGIKTFRNRGQIPINNNVGQFAGGPFIQNPLYQPPPADE